MERESAGVGAAASGAAGGVGTTTGETSGRIRRGEAEGEGEAAMGVMGAIGAIGVIGPLGAKGAVDLRMGIGPDEGGDNGVDTDEIEPRAGRAGAGAAWRGAAGVTG